MDGSMSTNQGLTLRADQREALQDLESALLSADRVQCIRACGTGKSLIAAELARTRAPRHTVVFVPSLALMGQIIRDFVRQCPDLRFLSVCGDQTVLDKIRKDEDEFIEIDGAVTMDRDVIQAFLDAGQGVVFCTYQSSSTLVGMSFDLGIFDEAHRTSNGGKFALPVKDSNIRIAKRVFFTATSKGENGKGMSDPENYGEVAHNLPFSRAVKDGLICGYKIALIYSTETQEEDYDREAWALTATVRGISDHTFRKIITFHHTQKKARAFSDALSLKGVDAHYFSGAQKQKDRQQRIDDLRIKGSDDVFVCTNAKCLQEGVDMPAVDAVVFVDPKKSKVDIIQAVGRCMRRSKGKEFGVVLLPVFVPAGSDEDSAIAKSAFREIGVTLKALVESNDVLRIAMNNKLIERATGEKPEGPQMEDHFVKPLIVPEESYQLMLSNVAGGATDNADWMDSYEDLQAWLRLNNDRTALKSGVDVVMPSQTAKDPIEKKLGEWIKHQRQAIKGKGNCKMTPERHQLLQKIPGWTDEGRGNIDDLWDSNYAQVLDFVSNNNKMPSQGAKDPIEQKLGKWITNQRQAIKGKTKAGLMTPERYILLQKIPGWIDEVRGDIDDIWDVNYNQVLDFAKQNNKMPSQSAKDPIEKKLGKWITHQRQAIKGKNEGKMTPDRLAKLRELPGWTDPE